MDDESRRAGTQRLVEAINKQEMEPFDTIHDDVVIEWPRPKREAGATGEW